MAQYTIKGSCGHLASYQLYGAGKDRDRKAAWLKTVPCLECKRQGERDAATASEGEVNTAQVTAALAAISARAPEARPKALETLELKLRYRSPLTIEGAPVSAATLRAIIAAARQA